MKRIVLAVAALVMILTLSMHVFAETVAEPVDVVRYVVDKKTGFTGDATIAGDLCTLNVAGGGVFYFFYEQEGEWDTVSMLADYGRQVMGKKFRFQDRNVEEWELAVYPFTQLETDGKVQYDVDGRMLLEQREERIYDITNDNEYTKVADNLYFCENDGWRCSIRFVDNGRLLVSEAKAAPREDGMTVAYVPGKQVEIKQNKKTYIGWVTKGKTLTVTLEGQVVTLTQTDK